MYCLTRSIALKQVLERRGVEARIQVGFTRVGNSLAGHAWVETDDGVVNDDDESVKKFSLRIGNEGLLALKSKHGFFWWH
jgi:hypothetical protein